MTLNVLIIRKFDGLCTHSVVTYSGTHTTGNHPAAAPATIRREARPAPTTGAKPEYRKTITQGRHTMKALSVKQPYAGLIIAGIKTVENRSWAPRQAPGIMAICSTATPDAARWWQPMREKCAALGVTFPEALCRINGAILGTVSNDFIVWLNNGDTVTDSTTTPEEYIRDWYNPGTIGWILTGPRRLAAPIPIKGRLGLYNLAAEIEAEITKQLSCNP